MLENVCVHLLNRFYVDEYVCLQLSMHTYLYIHWAGMCCERTRVGGSKTRGWNGGTTWKAGMDGSEGWGGDGGDKRLGEERGGEPIR